MLKQIRVCLQFGQESILFQGKKWKENRHAYVLVCRYKDTNLITWSCSYNSTTRKESLGHERVLLFGVYCLPH